MRSRPYSKFNPDFSQVALEKRLKQHGIKYMFMGDSLGGRPDDSSCYEMRKLTTRKNLWLPTKKFARKLSFGKEFPAFILPGINSYQLS
ncbi:MAG: DUF488 family protein [Ktedonobacteraceae bacterium]